MTLHERALIRCLMDAADRTLQTGGEELRELSHALRRCQDAGIDLAPVEEAPPAASNQDDNVRLFH